MRGRAAWARKLGVGETRGSKMGNRWTVVDGEKFQSKKEAERFAWLKMVERAGKITEVKRQVRFKLQIGETHLTVFVADFTYTDPERGFVIEDVKGRRDSRDPTYQLWRLKARLMSALLGHTVTEI